MAIFVEFESALIGKKKLALRADQIFFISGNKDNTVLDTASGLYVVRGRAWEVLHAIVGALEGRLPEARLEMNRDEGEIPAEGEK